MFWWTDYRMMRHKHHLCAYALAVLICMGSMNMGVVMMVNGDGNVCEWTSEDGSTIYDLSLGPSFFEGQDQYQLKYKVNLCGAIEQDGNCVDASG
jgi:hypothetical protein